MITNIVNYFRSKASLMAEIQRHRAYGTEQYLRAEGLDDSNDELERRNRNQAEYIEHLRKKLDESRKAREREGQLAALEKDVILRTVAGLWPALLERLPK